MMQQNDFRAFDDIATAIYVFVPHPDGVPRIAFFNAVARNSLTCTLEQVQGKTFDEVFPGRIGQNALSRHIEAMNSAQPCSYDTEWPSENGNLWLRTRLTPVLNGDGKISHVVATVINATTEKKALELCAQMQTKQSEMEQFVSLAAHDLRTPLRHIRYIGSELREDFVDMGDGKIDLLDDLDNIAEKASVLISDVLKVSQSRTMETPPRTFRLAVLCENIAAVLDPSGAHRITWPDHMLYADMTAVHIVLRNLVDNALKHGGKGQLSVKIDLEPSETGSEYIEMAVTDNGNGFADAENLFSDNGVCQTSSGFGLLAVRNLILARRGTIRVDKTGGGQGSTVRFKLPGMIVEPEDDA
ncbi:PAS domain-containing sensor histidine kinase [Puniceibacterium sediminis]|uniref:histidine kinase n=1 Tax=Puniceibacterium sediminis TaxID=1608407 RepID=A0A238XII6_9RHOB|nr:PAS domain-containing sensor histidine kinase [Puniceibacterium sediminis]SNR58381.1 hypothetical protein SAMN06265370_11196 [Puniceibacterium sediminis]